MDQLSLALETFSGAGDRTYTDLVSTNPESSHGMPE